MTRAWIVGIVTATAGAQEAPRPAIVVKAESLRETFVRQVNSFGSTRVGVVSGDPSAIAAPGRLSIYLPRTVDSGNLCVRVVTVDGQYEARITIPQADLPKGPAAVPLEFDSKFAKDLVNKKAGDIAIEAMIASSCESRSGQVLVASWQKTVNDRDFWVLVNSGDRGGSGIVTKVTAVIGGKQHDFACEDVKADRPLSFDKRCRVQLESGVTPTRLAIMRSRFDNQLPSAPISIRWP